MANKGSKIPVGSKVSVGSKYASGKSEGGSSSSQLHYWELQLEAMNRTQLREKARNMKVSTSGSKEKLKNRIKKELMKEKPISDNNTALQNIPEGSITTTHFEEEKFQVAIIDHDIEPHITAKTERLDEGIYSVKQETFVGETENLIVTVSDPSPYQNTSLNNSIMTKKVPYSELSRTEKRIQSKKAREYLEENDPLWGNKSTQGKHEAVTRYIESGKLTNFQREAEFENDLKKEFDLINENKRAGNMVRIPDVWQEMKTYGYTKEEFDTELFRMEKERIIELQTASDPKLIPEDQRKLGIPHENRGHINYVVWRKTDTIPDIMTKKDVLSDKSSEKSLDLFEKKYPRIYESNEKKGYYLLYHGSNEKEKIMKEGLKGGNDFGSRDLNKESAILHLTPDFDTAKKYGDVVQIRMSKKELEKLSLQQSVNNAGELEYYIDGLDPNEVTIKSENLVDLGLMYSEEPDLDNPLVWDEINDLIRNNEKEKIKEWEEYFGKSIQEMGYESKRADESDNSNNMTKNSHRKKSDVQDPGKTQFQKREVIEKTTVEIPKGRGFNKIPARVVPKGNKPYEWQIAIPHKSKTKDLTKHDKIIITEKSEVANTVKGLDTDYYVHNLGGNPFGSVQRYSAQDSPDKVRRSKKTIVFRQDQAFASFFYPNVSKDAEVVIIADEDYLGQYLAENLAQTLPTNNITIYNVESTSPQLLQEVLDGKHPEYEHDVNKAIGGAWYIESQSEVGATLTSALTAKNSILDHFTRDQRGNQTWSHYKKAYLQGALGKGLTISDQELAVTGKVLQEELNQDVRIIATIKTDLGLQTVEANAKSSTTDIDAVFTPIGEPKDLNVKNTDQTTMIIMSDLQVESTQAEDLIKRLASQGVITYPRTEYEGISPKESIDSEELADVWLSYHPEYQTERASIIKGIEHIQETTPELPRSGILVLNKSDFKANTIERNTVESIAKANIWASLNYYEIDGEIQIIDQNKLEIGKESITIISKDPKFVGQVIDVQTEKRQGMSDKEMFEFLSKEELGTVATRTNLVKRLEEWGFLLKSPKGEYKLDDRMKVMVIAVGKVDPSLTTGEFSNWLKEKRVIVAKDPMQYNPQKAILYNRLALIVSDLSDERVIQQTERDFQNISRRTQLDNVLRDDLQDDMVQLNEFNL